MSRNHILILSLVLPSLLAAQPRERISLDDGWRFHLGNASDPAKDFNYNIDNIFAKTGSGGHTPISTRFNDSTWRVINVPHDWAVELPFSNSDNFDVMGHGYKPVGGLYPETSIGWYRKHFSMTPADSGKRYSVTFDGIFRDAMIWLNGYFVGNNLSGYSGVTYDVTDYVNFHGDNWLVVRVDATQYEGWFYEGAGIYRHVWLNVNNNVHISQDGLFVHADVKDNGATITVEATLRNQALAPAGASWYAAVLDRNGKELTRTQDMPVSLALNEIKTVTQQLTLSAPHLWSLEDPYLYKVVCVVRSGATEIDRVRDRFGIRTVTIDPDKGLFLNGKHVKIQGVCCHQDHAGVGSALPDYLQYYRIRLLKEMGVNGYRTSHNPPTSGLLDACDSLGVLVLDEARLLNSSPEYLGQLERLILRDRNHPSIFMWSIGNEEFATQQTSYGKRIAQSMIAKQQELDPTRTSTYASDLPNVLRGINEVIPVRGFNYRQFAVADYHHDHPEQPVMGTEMGSTVTTRGVYEKDTIIGYLPDHDLTAPWWATTAEKWWPLAAENDYWLGGFVWTGFDYRGEPTPFRWPNINSHFGIMDMCGFPKNNYYYYQSWWRHDKDVVQISPHWNWEGREGQPIDVWVNSNADEVELFLNGKSLGKKQMNPNSHLQWSVPYKAGTLEARAARSGRKFSTKVETTGRPVKVQLTPDRTMITADGRDATVVNVTVLDTQGRAVPVASNLVRFKVTGDAEIIGVGNGDPSSHEPDKILEGNYQRSLFNGKCQMILQAGKKAGTVKVEASADGLQAGTCVIIAK